MDRRKIRPERRTPPWDDSMPRPLCECHSEPMVKNGTSPWGGGIKWQCRVKNRARSSEHSWRDMPAKNWKSSRNHRRRRIKLLRKRIAELEEYLAQEE